MHHGSGRGPVHHDGIHDRIASPGSGSPLLLDIRTTRPRCLRPSSRPPGDAPSDGSAQRFDASAEQDYA